ncbi:MAG: S8 family serine peptidase, partial [Candidatus Thalassarchaeaceae archaeon]|nr:S8 family serine peptidase [Candidatus Thalassarchaeaceae archaeon]
MEHLELMPEPDDSRILTAVDPAAPGYPGSEYGISDQEAKELRWPLGPMKEYLWPWGAVSFSIGTILIIMTWPWIQAFLIPILPDSEWAYENSGFREMQTQGYFGEGVHICIVDTGIDMDHPDLENINLRGFRDFYEEKHDEIRDVGESYHGTLMSGLMVANGTYTGAAPEVSLSVAIALGPDGGAEQSDRVSNAIRWCR